jgi:hypothetical protein
VFYALVQNLTQLNFPVLLIFVVLMSKGTHHRSSQRNFGIADLLSPHEVSYDASCE